MLKRAQSILGNINASLAENESIFPYGIEVMSLDEDVCYCRLREGASTADVWTVDNIISTLAYTTFMLAANAKTMSENRCDFVGQTWSLSFLEPDRQVSGEIYAKAKRIAGYDDAPIFKIDVFGVEEKQIAIVTAGAVAV
jgi:hypothetical protein